MNTRIRNPPISAGYGHYGIIDQNGILYMSGFNEQGQLGIGNTISHKVPVPVQFDSKVISISCGFEYSSAVTEKGEVYVWGEFERQKNLKQVLPDKKTKSLVPIKINFTKAAKVYSFYHGLGIITSNLKIYIDSLIKPEEIDGSPLQSIVSIQKSGKMTGILSTDGKLYMRGRHTGDDQDILEEFEYQSLPELIKQISFGDTHYSALSFGGNVYMWGSDEFGRSGFEGQVVDDDLPPARKLKFSLPISQIEMGDVTSAALTEDGMLYMWGANIYGMILNETYVPDWFKPKLLPTGYPNSKYITLPTPIDVGAPVSGLALGGGYVIAVTNDGIVNYWGNPKYGPGGSFLIGIIQD